MTHALRVLKTALILALALVALALAALLLLTRTPLGVTRAGEYVLGSFRRQIHGSLRVGSVRSRSLLGGVTLHDVAIDGPTGAPFLRVDSVSVGYDWRSLVRGRIVLHDVTLYHPVLELEQVPGDTLWNFEHIFLDTTAGPSANRLILLRAVHLVNGFATVAYPLSVKGRLQPSDTARLLVRHVPTGWQRVMRFEGVNGRLPRVLWSSPDEPGRLFNVDSIAGLAYVWQEPVPIRQGAGTLASRDSIVSFDFPTVRLPVTRGSILGRVIVRHEQNDYDVRVRTDTFSFSDLGWVYPRFPAHGGGSGELRILTVPRGTLWLMQDARIQAPGTRVAGSFGIVTGDTLYFTKVSLRASPFDLELVESMLPGGLPVKGLLVGTVVVDGPLSALDTHGDLHLAGRGGGENRVDWRGTLDLRAPYAARAFTADLHGLDLALLSVMVRDLPLTGSVSGRIQATGRLDRSLRLVASLDHERAGAPPSHIDGSGSLAMREGSPDVDLQLRATPFELGALTSAFPFLTRLEGQASGPVTVRGTPADLGVHADLETPAGPVTMDGRFDLTGARPIYHATGTVTGFRLGRALTALPAASTLTARFRVDGSGADLASAAATAVVHVDTAHVGALAVHDGLLRLDVRDGVARVDTLTLPTNAGRITGDGSLGLAPGRSGTVRLAVRADSLAALRPFFFPDTLLLAGAGAQPPSAPYFDGDLRASAKLVGSISDFDVSGDAALDRLVFGELRARRATLRFTGSGVGGPRFGLHVEARADSVRLGARQVDTAAFALDYAGPEGVLRFDAAAPGRGAYRLSSRFRRAGDGLLFDIGELRFGGDEGLWRLAAPARLRVAADAVDLDSLSLVGAGGGSITAHGALGWSARDAAGRPTDPPLSFALDVERASIPDFLRLAQTDPRAGGVVSGRLSLGGSALAPVIGGTVTVDSLRYGDRALQRLQATMAYADHRLDLRLEGREGGRRILAGNGRIPLDLALAPDVTRRPREPLAFTLETDTMPAGLLTSFVEGIEDTQGSVTGTLRVGGTTADPSVTGELALRDGGMVWTPAGVRYRDLEGTARMQGDRTVRVALAGRSGGGTARIEGTVAFNTLDDPRLALTIEPAAFLAARRRDVDLTASGRLQLGGSYRSPRISGRLTVERGTLYLDQVWRQYNIVELDDPLLFDVVDTSVVAMRAILPDVESSPFLKNLVVSGFTMDVGRDAWLRGKDMNVEVTGALSVEYGRQADSLRIAGSLTAVRGTYQLYGRRFEIQSGTVEFFGTPDFDPGLDFTAVYHGARSAQGDPLNIQANVTGTLQNPRVTLTSDATPAINESDLASYLLFGRPTYALAPSEQRALGTAASRLGALSAPAGLLLDAIGPSFLGYAASGLEAFAQNLGLDYVSLSSAEVAQTDPGTPLGLLSRTQLEVGRYVGDDLFVAFTQSLSGMGGATEYRKPGVKVEWRLLPSWTAEFFADDRWARMPSYGLEQTAQAKKVFGMFLFREWGY